MKKYYCTHKNILLNKHKFTTCSDCCRIDKPISDPSTIPGRCKTYNLIEHKSGGKINTTKMKQLVKHYLRKQKLERIFLIS